MAGILTAPAVSLALRFEALHAASRDDPAPGWELRRDRLHRLRRLLTLEQGGLLAAIAADFGQRPLDELRAYELFPCVSAVDHALRHGQRWMRPQSRPVSWWAWPGRGELRHQPLGVVGIIAPWNYPLYLSVGPLVDALVAGNRALIKVSELSPAFGAALAQAVERHFRPDEVGVVQGDAAVAAEFAALPFDHLIFTGSTRVGREVMRIASAQLTPVTLELGGKSPALIGPGGRSRANGRGPSARQVGQCRPDLRGSRLRAGAAHAPGRSGAGCSSVQPCGPTPHRPRRCAAPRSSTPATPSVCTMDWSKRARQAPACCRCCRPRPARARGAISRHSCCWVCRPIAS